MDHLQKHHLITLTFCIQLRSWKTVHRSVFLTKRDVTFALSSDDEEVTLGPLIKTETTDNGQGQQTATQTVL